MSEIPEFQTSQVPQKSHEQKATYQSRPKIF